VSDLSVYTNERGALPVTASDVDEGENDLVWQIVNVEQLPAKSFVLASEVDFVEDDDVDEIHYDCGAEQDTTERWAHIKGYWENEGC
jgi:hypothetical protein